jgi:hypothetical protein
MDLRTLAVGTKLQLDNGATVEVASAAQEQRSVRVRYLDSPFEPELEGTEQMLEAERIYGAYTDDSLMQVRPI